MRKIIYKQIGVVRSPFKEASGTPIQSRAASKAAGEIRVLGRFSKGLKDIEGFSHLLILYHLHLSRKTDALEIKPFLDTKTHGVFATRSPCRPNNIGLSIVRLVKRCGSVLQVSGLDMLDGTPVLDIKPYVPQFDNRPVVRIGWLKNNVKRMGKMKDDGRFKRQCSMKKRKGGN